MIPGAFDYFAPRTLEGAVPNQKPDRINASPVPGLYELTFGAHVVYVSQDGRYLLNGDVIDLTKQDN
ncbi:MAG: DsbC family protein, partial [Acidobacteria bacterium]|nr:DsbC family protein [Acidobacteriota bacterium]